MSEACLVEREDQLLVLLLVPHQLAVVGEHDVLLDLLVHVLLDRPHPQEAVGDQLEVLNHRFGQRERRPVVSKTVREVRDGFVEVECDLPVVFEGSPQHAGLLTRDLRSLLTGSR